MFPDDLPVLSRLPGSVSQQNGKVTCCLLLLLTCTVAHAHELALGVTATHLAGAERPLVHFGLDVMIKSHPGQTGQVTDTIQFWDMHVHIWPAVFILLSKSVFL